MGMKKRISIFMLAVLGMAIQGEAQEVEVPQFQDMKVPKFLTFVMANSNNVNIRESPSVLSAKLVWQQTGDGFWDGQFMWDKTAANPSIPAMKKYSEKSIFPVFPVIEEKGEWYHILFNDMGSTYDAFILKSLCMSMQQKPITESYVKGYLEYAFRDDGKYKGYTLLRGRLFENDGDGELLFVGRIIDGICAGKGFDPLLFMDNEQAINFYSDLSIKKLEQITDGQIDKLFGYLSNSPTEFLYGIPGIYREWNGEKNVLNQHFGIYSILSTAILPKLMRNESVE